jgi:hypothetical protein
MSLRPVTREPRTIVATAVGWSPAGVDSAALCRKVQHADATVASSTAEEAPEAGPRRRAVFILESRATSPARRRVREADVDGHVSKH